MACMKLPPKATKGPVVGSHRLLESAEVDLVCEALRMMQGTLTETIKQFERVLPGANSIECMRRWREQAADLQERLQS